MSALGGLFKISQRLAYLCQFCGNSAGNSRNIGRCVVRCISWHVLAAHPAAWAWSDVYVRKHCTSRYADMLVVKGIKWVIIQGDIPTRGMGAC